MAKEPDKLIFQDNPTFLLASNIFINVSTILQYKDAPLIEMGNWEQAGYTSRISIYHPDGTYLAKVVGSRLFDTPESKKAGVTLHHPDKMTVCEMKGRTLFELRRHEAAALKTSAELYAPDGCFVKASDVFSIDDLYVNREDLGFPIGEGIVVPRNLIVKNAKIGIHCIDKDNMALGVEGTVSNAQGGAVAPSSVSNIRISYRPYRSRDHLIGVATSLDRLLWEIERQRGPFSVAMLLDVDLDTGKALLLVHADWISQGMPASLSYIQRHIKNGLAPDQFASIAGYAIEWPGDPSMLQFRSHFATRLENKHNWDSMTDVDSKRQIVVCLLRCSKP